MSNTTFKPEAKNNTFVYTERSQKLALASSIHHTIVCVNAGKDSKYCYGTASTQRTKESVERFIERLDNEGWAKADDQKIRCPNCVRIGKGLNPRKLIGLLRRPGR